jgi:hypothetical protein
MPSKYADKELYETFMNGRKFNEKKTPEIPKEDEVVYEVGNENLTVPEMIKRLTDLSAEKSTEIPEKKENNEDEK